MKTLNYITAWSWIEDYGTSFFSSELTDAKNIYNFIFNTSKQYFTGLITNKLCSNFHNKITSNSMKTIASSKTLLFFSYTSQTN